MQISHDKIKKFNPRCGITYEVASACGSVFVTCNNDKLGRVDEIFIRLGKAGGCAMALTESLGRLISHHLQIGGSVEAIIRDLAGVSCYQACPSTPSCVSAVASAIAEHIKEEAASE